MIRVATVAELLDVGEVLARQPLPCGRQVGVVANSAALCTLALGACAAAGLGPVTRPGATVPLTGDSDPSALGAAVAAALADERVQSLLVVLAPPLPGAGMGKDPAATAHIAAVARAASAQASAGPEKPVLVTLVGSAGASSGVPVFATVEEAVRALVHVTRYVAWRVAPAGTWPELSDVDNLVARQAARAGAGAQQLLRAYGIGIIATHEASTLDQALSAAAAVGYPVAVKSADPYLRHRFDLGAVRLELADPAAVRLAYAAVAQGFGPDVLVQPMAAPGVACAVEAVDHPTFGPMIGFGIGGVALDLLGDRAWRVAPLTDRAAAELVRAPGAAGVLTGYRGAPVADLDALAELLLRVSRLADETPQLERVLLNPVMAHTQGVSVLHAQVWYGDGEDRPDTGPRHLE